MVRLDSGRVRCYIVHRTPRPMSRHLRGKLTKVWAVNFGGHDYRDAERYGEVVPITSGYVAIPYMDRIQFEFIKAAEQADKDDWLLLSGFMVLNAIASAIWMHRFNRVKMLVFDPKHKLYRETILESDKLDYLFAKLNGTSGVYPKAS